MAHFEGPHRVVIEFLRSSGEGCCGGRAIKLTHSPDALPPQLAGRVDPALWASLWNEARALADRHPYVQRPTAARACSWAACFALGAAIGFCCMTGDGGEPGPWEADVQALVNANAAAFAAAGCALVFERAREYRLVVAVNPGAPVEGRPVDDAPKYA